MTTSCTLICSKLHFSKALEIIRREVPGVVDVDGTADAWRKVRVAGKRTTLVFTSLTRVRPGDEFSSLVLSMHNFVRRVKTSAEDNKRQLLRRISHAAWFIGVVAEPDLSDDEGHLGCLGELCHELDAVIFNGDAFLDRQGDMILNSAGDHEVDL